MADNQKLSLAVIFACLIIGCNSSPTEPPPSKQLVVIPSEGVDQPDKGSSQSIIQEPIYSPMEIEQQKIDAMLALDKTQKELILEEALTPKQVQMTMELHKNYNNTKKLVRDDEMEEDPFVSTIRILSQPINEQF